MLNYTSRLANRLSSLRHERGWSLDQLAKASGLSRASLSRLENAEVSPTADSLGKLCAAFGLPMSRLLMMVEDSFAAHVPFDAQPEWEDPETGFTRRSVSPPATQLAAEVIEAHLPPGKTVSYAQPPKPGQEHHLIVLDGELTLSVDGVDHRLTAGDCLRYQLYGASRFDTPAQRGARYILVLV
ncbi:MAG: helix-turn-helix domain-containing protein [Rhodobiaceae bacterium]|jgi:transcriptional regulator with XRE-family HTH domain|nr:helix-turn-helix domain-containing protein [Rhodobiaceae bacterium]